ncbi:hypothetical protein GE061_000402 [Apolygus lucorum]|uniref:Uncharacterized protein n=1 Tax=Apolygus lucorum TaxID=248454 RepID=A0A6A4K0H2_APOLU|nr:hypothetical protein GE061_000402 [Apolygus lucorum]
MVVTGWLTTKQKVCGPQTWVGHPVNKLRERFGEYHNLFPQLKKDEDRFTNYMRMATELFKYQTLPALDYMQIN